jgi:hypothetical protein
LDEEDIHLTEHRVTHLVNALRQPQSRAAQKREREWVAEGFGAFPEGTHFGKLQQERAIRDDNSKILVEAGGKLFAADLGEIEHAATLLDLATEEHGFSWMGTSADFFSVPTYVFNP